MTDKRALSLAETTLVFSCILPDAFIPDNGFCSKIFESLEFTVNHESISNRSSDAEYYITDHFLTQLSYDVGVMERGMAIRGTWDANNYDASGITDLMKVERGGHRFKKSDGSWWRQYNFITPINLGFAREGRLLPGSIPYRLFIVFSVLVLNIF